jgi:hypothetical protein
VASCTTDSALCLSEGRFLITATWTKPDGESGPAHAANLTVDSGYFWFFDPANVEVAIKTLNGCGVNGRYWVFAGGLTNLKVDIAVTDMTTNITKHYPNAQGTPFQLVADTSAFTSCSAVESTFAPDPEEISDKSTLRPIRLPALSGPDSTAGCATTDTVLCTSGRFQVTVNWQSASGESGAAHAVALTPEAGYFWFFDPANVELRWDLGLGYAVRAIHVCANVQRGGNLHLLLHYRWRTGGALRSRAAQELLRVRRRP